MRIIIILSGLLFSSSAYAKAGGDGDAFYIVVSIFMAIAIAVAIIVNNAERARQNDLVENGKAIFLVKISRTGHVYHSMSCGKCKAGYQLSESDARARGFTPCSTCGGRGKFQML